MSAAVKQQHHRKLENTWNKLARYQHHERFLSTCLEKSVIPKGLELNFNLSLLSDNVGLQRTCKQHLFAASLNLLKEIHSAAKKELLSLVGDLGRARIEATRELGKEVAEPMIVQIKSKISKLKAELIKKEKFKLRKAIRLDVPVVSNLVNTSNGNSINNQSTPKKRTRRFDKKIRLSRRRSNAISSAAVSEVVI
jgi:hypothetical protein